MLLLSCPKIPITLTRFKHAFFLLFQVYWYNKRSNLIISSDINIDIEDRFNPIIDGFPKYDIIRTDRFDQSTYSLLIRRMQLTDAGKYVCQVHVKGLSEMPAKEGEPNFKM